MVATPVVPVRVQHAIVRRVLPGYRYVPTRLPSGWRYFSWNTRRGGRDLTIWFTTPDSYVPCGSLGCTPKHTAGPGFGVVGDASCSLTGAMKIFHVDRASIAWSATFEDAQAWRCVGDVRLSVSSVGMGNDPPRVVDRRASALANLLASVTRAR